MRCVECTIIHAAEELASQVFEEGIRDIKRFQYRGVPVRAWLFGIAHHVCADYLKKSRRVRRRRCRMSWTGTMHSRTPESARTSWRRWHN